MIRQIRLVLYFLVGVMLSAVTVLSYAETQPATSEVGWWDGGSVASKFSTASAVCAYVASVDNRKPWYNVQVRFSDATHGMCTGQTYYYGGGAIFNTIWDFQAVVATTVLSCPTGQNWTLSGTNCTRPDCTADQERDSSGICIAKCVSPAVRNASGICVVPSKVCYSIVVTPSGSCAKSGPCTDGEVAGLTFNQPICADAKLDPAAGCPPGGIVVGKFADGKPICLSPPPSDAACTEAGGTVAGTIGTTSVCSKAINPLCADGSASIGTANGSPVCQDTCPAGSATGTLNGVTSCWPVGKINTAGSQSKGGSSTTTTPPGGGAATTTTVDSSTTCTTDGGCTTTSVSTTNGSSTTTTTQQSQTDFCAKNPTDKNCASGTTATKEDHCASHPTDKGCQVIAPATCNPKVEYCGDGKSTGLYDKQVETPVDSLAAAFRGFRDELMAMPFATAMTGFFSVTIPVGACPAWSATIPYFNKGLDLRPYFCTPEAENMMKVAGAVLLAVAAFGAYKWAVL